MASKTYFQRAASPAEQRTIAREDAGFYHAVIIGAVYDLGPQFDLEAKETFYHPLAHCIKQSPWLYVAVGDRHTDKSFYESVQTIRFSQHIDLCSRAAHDTDSAAIARLVEDNLDKPHPAGIPPWRILVMPLSTGECFVGFVYSHMIGDGMSGSAFHRAFLQGLRTMRPNTAVSPTMETPKKPLPPPFDTPDRLTISWSFLLAPLFAFLLPQFIANLLGVQASASGINEGTWTAQPMFFDPEKKTKLRMIEVESAALNRVLRLSREHQVRLTGLLNHLIARVLSRALPSPTITNFISQTAINLRRALGMSNVEMGGFVSGCYLMHPRNNNSGALTQAEWTEVAACTDKLTRASVTLQDQAIGLLRYLSSIRSWTLGKIGERRDCSFEMSNIGSFDGGSGASIEAPTNAKITKMVFGQPGHVGGPPICFNFASVKQGSLVCTVTWQPGALGVQNDEAEFVDELCAALKAEIEGLA
ncbi:alcohol acetyltransferase [Stachybotrys elegans]|uniref:Alcohol acetyltransferase n=1 Tax=Stachybotrys elegans TaxID=80388 RepID=A0A8K0T1T0_9HYPO|nr:alcohol acetyltransferase [Stachybotrys elegans]